MPVCSTRADRPSAVAPLLEQRVDRRDVGGTQLLGVRRPDALDLLDVARPRRGGLLLGSLLCSRLGGGFRRGLRRSGGLGGGSLGGEVLRRHLALAGGDAVGERPHDERARADGVVVARDHELGLVGVAVRIDECDHRQVQALRLADGERLLLQVDDEDRVRLALHVGDAAEVRLELLELGLHRDPLLGRQQGELPVVFRRRRSWRYAIRSEIVRQLVSRPPSQRFDDERHADARRLVPDGVLGLLLRADEEDRAAALGDVARKVVRVLDELLRLLQVDDVDAAALGEDEALHLRVPAACLVAEVNSSLQ